MKFILLIAILGCAAFAALIIVIALYRHKNSAVGELKLIGESCQVTTSLTPEGSVMIRGELWRAQSADGTFINAPTEVRIVAAHNHLLIVTEIN